MPAPARARSASVAEVDTATMIGAPITALHNFDLTARGSVCEHASSRSVRSASCVRVITWQWNEPRVADMPTACKPSMNLAGTYLLLEPVLANTSLPSAPFKKMKLDQMLKTALNENRLLILGTQVLFGFQFNGIFQDQFDQLPLLARGLECAGLTLPMLSVAFLIAPSMEHQIVERGQDSPRVLKLATLFAGCALLPLSVALAFDMYVVMDLMLGSPAGILSGSLFFAVAICCWYLLALVLRRKRETQMSGEQPVEPTPLSAKVDQLLTEARLIIPGAQALLGFQLTVTLTKAFSELPTEAKLAHAAALCSIGLAVLFLMAPASLHRIAFGGEDDPQFVKVGSWFVVAAPLPLACGIALDTYVAAGRAVQSSTIAALLAVVAIGALWGTWYAYPIWRRTASR
jgi:Family of unknown function (DUF6328)